MFGIGVLCPPVYATLLLVKTITPNNLFETTRNYIFRIVLRKKEDRLLINESIEKPLLRELGDDSTESDNIVDEEPQRNPLLDYS
jgi:hypothetical protein